MSPLKATLARVLVNLYGAVRFVRPASGSRLLMYHAIGTPIPEDTQGRYTLSPQVFEAQMRNLKASGSHLLSLGNTIPAGGVAVTFDDGYQDNFRYAYPILRALEIPFTVCVTANNPTSGNPIFLQTDELKLLASDPLVTIAAHGLTHRPLTQLNDEELAFELNESRRLLEAIVGQPVVGMSYPHGAVDERVIEAVKRAGYSWAACSRFGSCVPHDSLYQLPRIDIWSEDSVQVFTEKLRGLWDWLGVRG